ncbi:hypothetical protein Fot_04261 [Forsythia ovata]|uniref:Uncharacterized protein n=1 Tax=Forsythia ovata TaxID=205694 RepID=A0ABD1XC30_9LAMI
MTNEKEFSSIWFQNKAALWSFEHGYSDQIGDRSYGRKINLNASQYNKIGASSLMKAQFELVDEVWTKPGLEVGNRWVEGAAHFMPPSPADWGAFMTDFWTFQANVMDNLLELRAQNRELMARKDHLDEMIKNLQDSEDED